MKFLSAPKMMFLVLSVLVFLFASACSPKGGGAGISPQRSFDKTRGILPQQGDYAPREVLVKFTESLTSTWSPSEIPVKSEAEAANAGVAARHLHYFPSIKASLMRVIDKTFTVERAATFLNSHSTVDFAEPNYLRRKKALPNDSYFDQLWGLNNSAQLGGVAGADIGGPEAWDIQTGSSGIVVAVIDTGVDYTHDDLAANLWTNPGEIAGNGIDDDGNGYIDDVYGINAANNTSDPLDDEGHGTHVAGIIGAVGGNGKGVVGVCQQIEIMALKMLGSFGGGTVADFVKCVDYIVTLKTRAQNPVNVRLVNASYGDTHFSQTEFNAIEILKNLGILFVTAAGNEGRDNDLTPSYPANYNLDNIISVAATNSGDNLASFSNFGATTVHVAAPGEKILSTLPGNYIPQSGDYFFDDMESGSANWTAQSPWQITAEQNHSSGGGNGLSDSPGANYASSQDLSVTSRIIDLSAAVGTLKLGFWIQGTLESGLDQLKIEISKDGGTSWDALGLITGTISAWELRNYEIPTTHQTANFHRFRLITNGSGNFDGVYIDDVAIGIARLYKPKSGDLFYDNMESGSANWTAQSSWQNTQEQNLSAGGSHCWSDSPGANYGNNQNISLTSNTIDLSGQTGSLRLGFWIKGDLEADYDYLYLEFSANGGSSWTRVDGYTGTISAWSYVSYPIPVALRTANFQFRFRLSTDSSNIFDGVYIDEVGIGVASPSVPTYDFFDGTSMSSPMVAGLAGLILSQKPSFTYSMTRQAIFATVDVLPSLASKVTTSGRVNAFRALNLLTPTGLGAAVVSPT